MSIADPEAFYNRMLEAVKDGDISYLLKVYHPDFKGKDHQTDTSLDYVLKKILYRTTRFNNREYILLGSHQVSPDIFVFLEYFNAFDTALNQPAELYTSITFQFKDNRIFREWLICCPFEAVGKTYEEHNITIARQQRCKLTRLLDKLVHSQRIPLKLSDKEIDCLYGYLSGGTYKTIGQNLHISEKTVETHLRNIKNKFKISQVRELKELFKLI